MKNSSDFVNEVKPVDMGVDELIQYSGTSVNFTSKSVHICPIKYKLQQQDSSTSACITMDHHGVGVV